jgi:hypothetical protein
VQRVQREFAATPHSQETTSGVSVPCIAQRIHISEAEQANIAPLLMHQQDLEKAARWPLSLSRGLTSVYPTCRAFRIRHDLDA